MNAFIGAFSPEADAVDIALDAYICWREACADAREAYRDWSTAGRTDRVPASDAYVAALDREDSAAVQYEAAMRRLGATCGAAGTTLADHP